MSIRVPRPLANNEPSQFQKLVGVKADGGNFFVSNCTLGQKIGTQVVVDLLFVAVRNCDSYLLFAL